MSSLRSRVNAELQTLVEQQHGTLKQQHIVDAARSKGSALYEDFARQGLWDDAKAAERARLDYAGRLIRLFIVRDVDDGKPPVRALVSLIDDRKAKSGLPGYRFIDDVMADDDLRAKLLETARMELRACRRRYEALTELAKVWSAIDEVESTHSKPSEMRASA